MWATSVDFTAKLRKHLLHCRETKHGESTYTIITIHKKRLDGENMDKRVTF